MTARRNELSVVLSLLLCWWSPAVGETIRMHSCKEYLDRIERESEDLSKLNFRDLYLRFYATYDNSPQKKVDIHAEEAEDTEVSNQP